MRFDFDHKLNTPKFELNEKDMRDASEIEAMMQTPGWKILKDYFEYGRECILDAGKDGIRTRAKQELSDIKWGILKGWDECNKIAERVVQRAKDFREAEERRKQEEKDEVRNDDGEI